MTWNICPFLLPSCECYPLVPAWPLEWSQTNSTHLLHDNHLGVRRLWPGPILLLQARSSDFVLVNYSEIISVPELANPLLCRSPDVLSVNVERKNTDTVAVSFRSFYIIIRLLSAPGSHLTSSPPTHESDPLHSSNTDTLTLPSTFLPQGLCTAVSSAARHLTNSSSSLRHQHKCLFCRELFPRPANEVRFFT